MKAILSLLVLFSLFSISNKVQAQQYSSMSCAAYTDCFSRNYYEQLYKTHQISCQTYGSAYAYGPAYTSQSCQWRALYGVFVSCAGYAQVATPYGMAWAWQNYYYTCN